jgi:hypothetical protein
VKLHERAKAAAGELLASMVDLGLRELQAVNFAARLTSRIGKPDRRIAVGGTQLQDVLRVRAGCEQVQHPARPRTDADQEFIDAPAELGGVRVHEASFVRRAAFVLRKHEFYGLLHGSPTC